MQAALYHIHIKLSIKKRRRPLYFTIIFYQRYVGVVNHPDHLKNKSCGGQTST